MQLDDLVNKIELTGKSLIEDINKGTSQANNLISKLNEIEASYDDPKICFSAFLLHCFLEDVFYNIIGDFPYHKKWGESVDIIRTEILTEIGHSLVSISQCLKKKDFSQCYEVYVDLVFRYLRKISKLNEVLNKSLDLE